MDTSSFCYWLKGFIEIGNPTKLTDLQLTIIKDHLDLVFKKETPNRVEYNLQTGYFTNQDTFTFSPFLSDLTVGPSC